MATGNDFADIFASAFRRPDGKDAGEFSSPVMPGGDGFSQVGSDEPGKVRGAIKYDFVVRRRVFLIHRPWERCQRCLDDVATNTTSPPPQGDIACPHNELGEYESVVNKILDGTYLFGSESEIVNKDGTVAVSVRWYEPSSRPKKRDLGE